MTDNGIFPYLQNMLDLTARRQQALASNIANIDTPGYKGQDVTFAQALDGATSTKLIELEGKMKENGNNVDLEKNMTELNKNGLQYLTLVQYMNQKIKTLRASISEGNR